MGRHVDPKQPQKFDDPHHWATWINTRSIQYKTHATLGHAKLAVSGQANGDRLQETYVYEFVPDTGWVQRHYYPSGTLKSDADLFQTTVKTKSSARPPSEAAIDKTIKSILEAGKA